MHDMLVRLMDLPEISKEEKELLEKEGIVFKRPIPPEKSIVVDWVGKHFSTNWADETEAAFTALPVNCFIAQREQEILGFACFESTAKNFFGPTGVLPSERGKNLGKILLVKSLLALKEMGYAYAIIGGVGPASYYEKTVGATIIEKSEKSIYQNLLKHPK
ncbi:MULTISPECIES: GNAT family N-acetyltransferase [Flagellimonas]|uniref:GNAT family N-acetyltransferase n=1 Tax=Flagellimonas hadalis TaxID=2597517 RepID=A0A5N5IMS9_9FLAO|nr:GNAT family N-acetyltransferase [Allomuricauda hadalis]KAB5487018.1 GNAT family N-acetyltransferase [Allomuricauda hadalis]RUA17563.1 MAG: GNAT family N-acetyltransferase [Flavobacteriia bacterium]